MLFNAPDVIMNIKEMKAIFDMTDKMAELLDKASEEIEDNIFITSASEEKIAKMEKLLKINKLDTDTLEERRFRVKSRVYKYLPYTIRTLKTLLNSLCGEGNYKVDLDIENLILSCIIPESKRHLFAQVSELLDDIVPLNTLITIIISFVSGGQIRMGARQIVSGRIMVGPYIQKEYVDIGQVYAGALTSNISLKTRVLKKGES